MIEQCVGCGRPLLSFPGEFENLDSYYIEGGSPPEETSGEWHSKCLHGSPAREQWCQRRVENYVNIRAYEIVAEIGTWTVLRNPVRDERIAFSRDGDLLGLTFPRGRQRVVPGGGIYGNRYPQYHLQLDDGAQVQRIQDQLAADKKYPVLGLFEILGIADTILHPEALEQSFLLWDRGLARHWSKRQVSARCDFGVFVPTELEPYVSRKKDLSHLLDG
jgi:hypothetical protein